MATGGQCGMYCWCHNAPIAANVQNGSDGDWQAPYTVHYGGCNTAPLELHYYIELILEPSVLVAMLVSNMP